MNRLLRWAGVLLAATVLAGCASGGPERDIDDPTNSLVFGYVDMSDAPTSASSAWILQVRPRAEEPYWGATIRDGVFYNSYLPPGSYQLTSLSGSSFFRGEYRYNFPKQGNETSLRITKPGIYYLGSYKYKSVKRTSMFQRAGFSLEPVRTPTEVELLKRILEDSEIKNSSWAGKIRAYLARNKS